MLDNIIVAAYLPLGKEKKAMKPPQLKGVICLAVIISVTILALTWMTRNRICELHYSGGGVELAAFMACNPGK